MTAANEIHETVASIAQDAEMATYGITRVPIDSFHVGGYRYSNLQDAISQAKRERGVKTPH